MLITVDHGPDGLHAALGISDERNDELKEGFKAVVKNCLDNGIATLTTHEEGFQLAMSRSRLVEEVVAKLAQTPEELVICTMYVHEVQENIEQHCRLVAFKQKLEAEIGEIEDED